MLLSSRDCPLITVANGPLMARQPLRPELAAPLDVWPSSQLAQCAAGRGRKWRLEGDMAVLTVLYAVLAPDPGAANNLPVEALA